MSKIEYTLNAVAWSLAGVILTLTYQRIANWYRKRNNLGQLPPISPSTYFGSLLVLFAIIATLFSYSGKLAAERNKKCQTTVNENNVAVINQLIDEINGKHGFISNINELKKQELKALEGKLKIGPLRGQFVLYFDRQSQLQARLAQHRTFPVSSCDDGQLPGHLQTTPPSSSTPSKSPSPSPSSS